jgi:hypothetical protein
VQQRKRAQVPKQLPLPKQPTPLRITRMFRQVLVPPKVPLLVRLLVAFLVLWLADLLGVPLDFLWLMVNALSLVI